jgi:hypothetical protein
MLELPFYFYGYLGLGAWLLIVCAVFYCERGD